MGQKVDPRGLRLGITRSWDSNWYADKKEYAKYFHEDVKVREFVKKAYYHAGVSKVLVAESIATQIEKRIAYKKAMTQAIGRAMKAGAKGIKVMVSGRLNGAEIARSEWAVEGKVPLHTLRADIDYAVATAHTTYGALGIKVWVFHGEVLPTAKEGGEA